MNFKNWFFQESKINDRKQLKRDYGLNFGMSIKSPPKHNYEDLINEKYLYLSAPSFYAHNHPFIERNNNKLVVVCKGMYDFSRNNNEITISSLIGRNEEGIFFNCPIQYLHIANEEELEHADALEKTFWTRQEYFPYEKNIKNKLFHNDIMNNENNTQILLNNLSNLKMCNDLNCQGLATELENNIYDAELWQIASDLLQDNNYNVTDLINLLQTNNLLMNR